MIVYTNFIILHVLMIILGIVCAIQGKTSAFGGQIIEGIKVRVLGISIIILSIVSILSPFKICIGIFFFELLLLGLAYFICKNRKPKVDEKSSLPFYSKKEEKAFYKELGVGVLKLFLILGSILGFVSLIFLIIVKLK